MPEQCEGFYFRHFDADPATGKPVETSENPHFLEAEDVLMERVRNMFKGRPDLLQKISCLENGLEVRLYEGTGFVDFEDNVYFYGRATLNGDLFVLELATEEILRGGVGAHEALDVVIHEIAHILDFLSGSVTGKDGLLPGWSAEEIEQYVYTRERERRKIRQGASAIQRYALTDDSEFLAVCIETFFARPVALRQTSPELYDLMRTYFRQDPAVEIRPSLAS